MEMAECIRNKSRYVELSSHPDFQNVFVDFLPF